MTSRRKHSDSLLSWPTAPWLLWALSSSLVLHGVAYASLGFVPRVWKEAAVVSEVTFEVKPIEESPPIPEPPATAEPEKAEPRSQPRNEPPAPKPAATTKAQQPSAAPVAAAPLDLSGVTLTNGTADGVSMPLGNGLAFQGPIGPGRARPAVTENPRPQPPEPQAAATPQIVPIADLSSRPVPPSLEDALRQNYPEDARRRGIGGSASIYARLDPDGVARQVKVQSETFAGFGEACRRTLVGSRWSAPKDRSGRAVATEIRYTCRFQVTP